MNEKQDMLRGDIIHAALSYKIVGCAFEVFKQIGANHLEKIYQRALAKVFKQEQIEFKEQFPCSVMMNGEKLGNFYLDFLINGEVVVELKRQKYFSKSDIEQTKNYLRVMNLKLGILINFSSEGVRFMRVVNIY